MPAILPGQMPEIPPAGKPGGIGEKVENVFLRIVGRGLYNIRSLLSGILTFALDTFLEGIEPFLIRAFRPLLTTVRETDGCPAEVKGLIDLALSGESQAGTAILGMIGQSVGGAAMGSVLGVTFAGWTRLANWRYRPSRPDIGMAQAMLRRGSITAAKYGELYRDVGWPDDLEASIRAVTQPRADIATLVLDAFRRGLGLESLNEELMRRGFASEDIGKILTVAKPIPQAGDLIHMAVREAWNDAVSARFGYDADFPGPFAEWMSKQGYDPEWAKRYWRAHWEVPGPTMGAEMLHRTSMTEADYATLLKVADYPQQWRQWMTEIAYAPYTRVDIRRMYQCGVLQSYAELVRAYKDIGYKDDKAQKLSDFTVLEYGETEKEATKSEILSAYQIGRLSLAEARGYLAEMRYPDWLIDAFIARIDLARVNALVAQRIAHAKTLYVNGQMSAAGVNVELNKIPLSSGEIAMYLESWEIDRLAKIARPSKSDLRKFFVENAMSEGQFRVELAGWQLSAQYIEWYVYDAKRDLVKAAQATSAAARAEALRVKTATEKTEYDEKVANIAVAIAERNLIIADLKASASPDMNLAELDRIGKQVAACQLQIKMLQLQKAQVWAEYLSVKGEGIVVGGPAPIGGAGVGGVVKG